MPIKSYASVFLVSFLLAACSTASVNGPEMQNVDTFATFISAAEKAAATNQNSLALPASFSGRDYSVKSASVVKGVYFLYRFSESPCVTEAMTSAEIMKQGYVKIGKSTDPHGVRRNNEGPANYAFHELYRYGTPDGTRSIDLDYTTVGGQACVRSMSIDFPE